ncbi:MAG: hypothetical protein IIZ00_02540 [Oscillospiraceae bacterium]|nr:hypothetical protein [Oscillospiraceae bacterium]
MEFKEGIGWRCCYDPETGRYTAETGGGVNHNLYEITKEIYDHVDDPDVKWPTSLISEGRHLYMTVNDRCGPPLHGHSGLGLQEDLPLGRDDHHRSRLGR